LPASPVGVGRPITDRQAWKVLAETKVFKSAVRGAERLAAEPMPEMTDDAFLDFSRTGNRTRGQAAIGVRRKRIPALALAECLEDRGRFIRPLEEAIRSICGEKTWVMPPTTGRCGISKASRWTSTCGPARSRGNWPRPPVAGRPAQPRRPPANRGRT